MADYTVEQVKENLRRERKWTERAIVRLYKEQTDHEKQAATTAIKNDVGFNYYDAPLLTSFAQHLIHGNSLSQKQLAIAQRKLPKYARQLLMLGKE
jgi:hypothetical protein